ncbi:MAG: DUF4214 domain-containing protein [Pseudomonadota bacterium]
MTMLVRQASIVANNYLSNSMVMSGNGALVAYVGTLGSAPNTAREVILHETLTGLTRTLGSINPALQGLETLQPTLSADGSTISFVISSTGQVGVLALATGVLSIASQGVGGVQGNAASSAPALSADGSFVVFESFASNLVPGDTNGLPDIFYRNVQTGTILRVAGTDSELSTPQISGDGTLVLFRDNLQLYAQVMTTGVRQLVSSGFNDAYAAGYGRQAYELAADGRSAVLTGVVTVIGHFDSRHGVDTYRRDLVSGELTPVLVPSQFKIGETLPSYTINIDPEVSGDGSLVTYVRSSTVFPDAVSFYFHDIARDEVSRFSPSESQPGRQLVESSLSSDGSHFAYVFRPASDGGTTDLLQISAVLRGNAAPGAGDQTIQGAIGIDMLTYPGARAEYIVSGRSITDSQPARNGRDTLVDVERLQFSDGNIALDIAGAGGQAFRLYQAAFDRAPDQAGVGFWINALDKGQSLQAVAAAFTQSAEFKAVFGMAPTNAEFVAKLYMNILHRPGDSAGIAFWTETLDQNRATVAEVLVGFSESQENVAALVGVLQGGVAYQPYS